MCIRDRGLQPRPAGRRPPSGSHAQRRGAPPRAPRKRVSGPPAPARSACSNSARMGEGRPQLHSASGSAGAAKAVRKPRCQSARCCGSGPSKSAAPK
eukprot:3889828-Alexandrium_andersonii.AAC.1